eukprot:TRINITY_DN96314_c0_g1_i1.p2 TRINITY_DN96314_c0_g1~~TRINITY_DN96314_c0_g1_i1.p2  ORF type:complete len:159 (+),score=53.07 TRINITY_DN96314_c0_g1_i1:166-642(+)
MADVADLTATGASADDLLMQMVSQGKSKEGKEAEKSKDGEEKKKSTPALTAPTSTAIMLIDSDSDEPVKASSKKDKKKDKKEKKKKKKEKSSSSEEAAKASEDSDDSDAPNKKRRINNFSSIRNVEKERAASRQCRHSGAAAAMALINTASENPYFAE